MPQKIVAGNWKMNCMHEEALQLTTDILEILKHEDTGDTRVLLCPPFVHLGMCHYLTKDESRIAIGAQNCSMHAGGAYTGEISAAMIRSVGTQYVIIGHSERRSYFGETNAMLHKKLEMALQAGLLPVFCCGETLNERDTSRHFDIVKQQLEEAVFLINENDFKKIIIAYEPVWAIGTGKTATSAQAQEMHGYIRQLVAAKYGIDASANVSILYGGSCNDQNAHELFSQKDIDGGLIGGASLKAENFVKIIKSF